MLIHDRYGVVLVVVAAVGAVAALVSVFRPQVYPFVVRYVRVMIALVAAQVAIGLILVATGERPRQFLHWLYGAATLAALPIAIAVGRRMRGRERLAWLAGGAVLTVLFALRAVATG